MRLHQSLLHAYRATILVVLATLSLTVIPSTAFAVEGVRQIGTSNTFQFYANNAPWADVHYSVNFGSQQNVRMAHDAANNNTYTTTFPYGSRVQYYFTVGLTGGGSRITPSAVFYAEGGGSSSSGGSSTSSSSSSSSSGAPAIQIQGEAGTRSGTARVVSCSTCSGGARVGYLGAGPSNHVTLNFSAPLSGSYTMTVYATVNGTRTFNTLVNGVAGSAITFSGTSWTVPIARTVTVTLRGGTNGIRFFHNTAAAPDLDRIVISGSGGGSSSSSSSSSSGGARKFIFGMRGDTNGALDVAAVTSNPLVIKEVVLDLAKPIDQRRMINGAIARGNNGNLNWSWHFVPTDWTLAEFAIELCDARPDYVEANIDYFVDVVGRYCPWSSYVKQEVQP